MVGEFAKHSSIKGIIAYHESKVEQGKAELIYYTTIQTEGTLTTKEFEQVVGLNQRSNKNLFFHGSINLAPGEKLTNQQFVDISKEYMKSLGYENTHLLVYKHSDKNHTHIHLLAPTIDFDGKKIKDFKDVEKSRRMLMKFEKDYGLTPTNEKSETAKVKLKEISKEKYEFPNAFNRAIKSKNERVIQWIEKNGVGKLELNKIPAERIEKEVGDKLGKEQAQLIRRILLQEGFLVKSQKSNMIKELDNYLIEGNMDATFKNLKARGIYARYIKASNTITYGVNDPNEKGKTFYVSSKNLPERFSFRKPMEKEIKERITVTGKPTTEQLVKHRSFLRNSINNALNKSKDMDTFRKLLTNQGIVLTELKNEGGTYGATFQQSSIEGMPSLKASDIDRTLSWANIQRRISENSKVPIPIKIVEPKPEKKEFEKTEKQKIEKQPKEQKPRAPKMLSKRALDQEDENKPNKKGPDFE